MMPRNSYRHNTIKRALENALSMVGEPSKQTLMFYMSRYYGISFDGDSECSTEEIELALRGILGSGSQIITERLHAELGRLH